MRKITRERPEHILVREMRKLRRFKNAEERFVKAVAHLCDTLRVMGYDEYIDTFKETIDGERKQETNPSLHPREITSEIL